MKVSSQLWIIRACLPALVGAFPWTAAFADSLTVELVKDTYYLFEPIIVNVTLHLEEPFVKVRDDPVEATRQDLRLRRHLYVQVEDGQGTACEIWLGRVFHATESIQRDFQATIFVLVGTMMGPQRGESVFRFWKTPGNYTLVVVDRDNRLESKEVPITILAPEDDAITASELFQSGGLATWLGLYAGEDGERAQPLFERLAREHPTTIYGKYARMALALLRADNLRNRRVKAEPGTYPGLAKELKVVITLFEPGHPLRSRTLWHLARTQQAPSVAGDPEETMRQLLGETNDGQMIREARNFLKEMARHRQKASETTGKDSQN